MEIKYIFFIRIIVVQAQAARTLLRIGLDSIRFTNYGVISFKWIPFSTTKGTSRSLDQRITL